MYIYLCIGKSQCLEHFPSISPKDSSPFTEKFKHVVLENIHLFDDSPARNLHVYPMVI